MQKHNTKESKALSQDAVTGNDGVENGMTERPGRKALFSGAIPKAPAQAGSSEEIAAHVQQLNEEIAAALSAAAAGTTVNPLEPARFGAEYTTLISAVNRVLRELVQDREDPSPGGSSVCTGFLSSHQ